MSEREDEDDGTPEPGIDGGTGPGVTPGDVETPGAATTPNEPDPGPEGEREPEPGADAD